MDSVSGTNTSNSGQRSEPVWSGNNSPESTHGNNQSTNFDSIARPDNTQANPRNDKAENAGEALTSTEHIANQLTTAEALAEQPTQLTNLSPLAGPAGMAARREFTHMPLTQSGAYEAYKGLGADDFAGPSDIRLEQLSNSTEAVNNAMRGTLSEGLPTADVVTGRSKSPTSTFGKLREPFDPLTETAPRISDIKDLSGLRVSVSPIVPEFADVYRTQSQVNDILGPQLQLKQDYIAQPNSWGYTGRVHSTLAEADGLTHEVQVGTKDISDFIDSPLENTRGDTISLHDVTGYKGEVYGVQLPDRLEAGYANQIGQITQTNRAGHSIADVPAVANEVSLYIDEVQRALPEKLSAPPAPELSTRAKLGNVSARGLGVLDITGSAYQVNQGVQILRSGGDTVEGVADVTAGSTGVISGVALTTGRIAAGTATGGVVAVVDGAKDIYVGVRDANVEQTAVGVVKSGAGTAMIVGVATANPLLIAGGAIAYGGAAIYQSRDAIASAATGAWSWTKSWF